MARPKKDSLEPSAQERIEAAFWDILEEGRANQLTVKYLCSRANVYPNTLYYHYDSIKDVADFAFSRSMLRELPSLILSGKQSDLFERALFEDPDLLTRMRRTLLFASCGLEFTRAITLKYLLETWSKELNVDPDKLSTLERNTFIFASNGILALMGELDRQNPIAAIIELSESPLGKGLAEQMRLIRESHQKS